MDNQRTTFIRVPYFGVVLASLLALTATAMPTAALAEDVCSDALKTLKTTASFSKLDRIRIGLSVNESSWSQTQHDAGLGVTLPIGDIPVSLSGSWKDAESAQQKLSREYKFSDNFNEQDLFFAEKIAEGAYPAYETCILEKSSGLHLLLQRVVGDSITVGFFFRSAAGDHAIRTVKLLLPKNARFASPQTKGIWQNVASGDPITEVVVKRIGHGNIDIQAEMYGRDNVIQQGVAMPTIVEPPRLSIAKYQVGKPQSQTETFNAFNSRTRGVIPMCFTPSTMDGVIVNPTVKITEWVESGPDVGIPDAIRRLDNEPPYQRAGTNQVCVNAGCMGYSYADGTQRANCSGRIIATASERFIQSWEPVPETFESNGFVVRAPMDVQLNLLKAVNTDSK